MHTECDLGDEHVERRGAPTLCDGGSAGVESEEKQISDMVRELLPLSDGAHD